MNGSRFSRVSRRAFVEGGVSIVALLGLSACSDDSALTSSSAAPADGTSPAAASTEESATSAASEATGAAAPDGATLTVDFTVAAGSSGGRGGARNPYVAVWVEKPGGEYVATVSLWHLQGGNDRWLSDLRAWYSASGGAETNSGATRAAGSYTVGWDLTDSDGARIPQGGYVLYIEGAREHGEYELLESEFTVGPSAGSGEFAPDADITAASWTYEV